MMEIQLKVYEEYKDGTSYEIVNAKGEKEKVPVPNATYSLQTTIPVVPVGMKEVVAKGANVNVGQTKNSGNSPNIGYTVYKNETKTTLWNDENGNQKSYSSSVDSKVHYKLLGVGDYALTCSAPGVKRYSEIVTDLDGTTHEKRDYYMVREEQMIKYITHATVKNSTEPVIVENVEMYEYRWDPDPTLTYVIAPNLVDSKGNAAVPGSGANGLPLVSTQWIKDHMGSVAYRYTDINRVDTREESDGKIIGGYEIYDPKETDYAFSLQVTDVPEEIGFKNFKYAFFIDGVQVPANKITINETSVGNLKYLPVISTGFYKLKTTDYVSKYKNNEGQKVPIEKVDPTYTISAVIDSEYLDTLLANSEHGEVELSIQWTYNFYYINPNLERSYAGTKIIEDCPTMRIKTSQLEDLD